MKITICGSIAFSAEMDQVKGMLEKLGHEVDLPPNKVKDEDGNLIPAKEFYERRKRETDDTSRIRERKREAMKNHFKKVERCDAVLILNYDKNSISNYIGPNTLLEMGLGFHLDKKIYLLQPVPEIMYKEEIIGMYPTVIDGDLSKVV